MATTEQSKDVVITDFRDEYANQLDSMFNEAFQLHQMVPAGKFLDDLIQVNVLTVLSSATWIRVAVREGRAVGIIAAKVANQKRHAGAQKFQSALARTAVRFLGRALVRPQILRQVIGSASAQSKVNKKAKANGHSLDNELLIFAVDESIRGTGVGGRLYSEFLAHLREVGASEYHLQTNTLCTYEFYDYKGLERAAENSFTLKNGTQATLVTGFVYVGKIPEQ